MGADVRYFNKTRKGNYSVLFSPPQHVCEDKRRMKNALVVVKVLALSVHESLSVNMRKQLPHGNNNVSNLGETANT